MSVGLQRASVSAITKEVSNGVYVDPTATDFVPLRPGNELNFEPDALDNDELINDIGAAKSAVGKESVSGSHSAYLKHSGVEGQEPEIGVLYESIMGAKKVAATEYVVVTGSTAKEIVLGLGEGVNFVVGQALLIKSSTGFELRNVAKITSDVLTLNFDLKAVPVVGAKLGKAITYLPAPSGHPTFSTTKYIGGSFAKEISAGNTVTDASFTMDANGYGEVEFSFEGTKYYFNPIRITSANKYLDFTDDTGTYALAIGEAIYKTPIELAEALEAGLNAISGDDYTVRFLSTGKFAISTDSSALSLLWNTGANAANSIGATIGFSVAADDTGATAYESALAQDYSPKVTPVYDTGDAIIIKGAELFIGDANDNICICAQSVAITISKSVEDVDCICEESGILEKIPTSRTTEISVTAVLKKHDVVLLNALLKNKGVSAMINAGPKAGGNWVGGKCFNAYSQTATVSGYTTTGDSFVQADITLKGYVSADTKDIFLNFI